MKIDAETMLRCFEMWFELEKPCKHQQIQWRWGAILQNGWFPRKNIFL